MIYGIQKYLMIALSAVFLSATSSALTTQDMGKTILPMAKVTLYYMHSEILLTRRNAEQLDRIIVHMRNKSKMRIVALHTTYNSPELIAKRITIVKAYMKDRGIEQSRITFKNTKAETCIGACPSTLILSEFSES